MSGLPLYRAMVHRDGELVDIDGDFEAPNTVERMVIRERLQREHGRRCIVTFEPIGRT